MENLERFDLGDRDLVTATLMHGRELLADGRAAVSHKTGLVSFVPEFVSSSTCEAPLCNLRLVISPTESHPIEVQSMHSPYVWRFHLLKAPAEIPQ